MITFSILDVTIYFCIVAPVMALLVAVPAFVMSSNLTEDSDKPKKRRAKKTDKKQKHKREEQDKRRMQSRADVLQVKVLAERLLEEIKNQEQSGSSDSELHSIRTELNEIIAEAEELK